MRASLDSVQWLSIDGIAEMWAPALELPKSEVLRELQFGLYKIECFRKSGMEGMPYDDWTKPLGSAPPPQDLPSPEAIVNREFIERFCMKQSWLLPEFWFKNPMTTPPRRGRPSIMDKLLDELTRLAASGSLSPNLAHQARHLRDWAVTTIGGDVPMASSIEKGIRFQYNVLKTATYG